MADLIFRGVRLIDGTGAPARHGDVAVSGDRIEAVGDLGRLSAGEEIEAEGLVLAPGFIDVHTHDDRYLLEDPAVPAKASQGVTTVVVGNCGFSLAPVTGMSIGRDNLFATSEEYRFSSVGDFLERLDRSPAALNSVTLVGHSSLRSNAMDRLERAATDAEIAHMRAELADGLAAGAAGLSTGLFYPQANAAPAEEVMAVAEELTPAGGIYTAHIRDEADKVTEAIDEAAQIARHAGVPLVISHHKTTGVKNFGRTRETLPQIERLGQGQHIGYDVYPYTAGSTMMLPQLAVASERVLVTWSRPFPQYAGWDLDKVAAEMGLDRRAAAEALVPGGGIYFMMEEDDVRRVLASSRAMIGSDGIPMDEHPHPRLWGTFPRVLGHYARDVGLFSLEEAVHRMTGLPAAEFALTDRGLIRVGAYADLVLFDPETVADSATFETPTAPSKGIVEVLVNGERVWASGRITGARPGRALRRGRDIGEHRAV